MFYHKCTSDKGYTVLWIKEYLYVWFWGKLGAPMKRLLPDTRHCVKMADHVFTGWINSLTPGSLLATITPPPAFMSHLVLTKFTYCAFLYHDPFPLLPEGPGFLLNSWWNNVHASSCVEGKYMTRLGLRNWVTCSAATFLNNIWFLLLDNRNIDFLCAYANHIWYADFQQSRNLMTSHEQSLTQCPMFFQWL